MSTYTYQNAIDIAAKYVKGVPTTAIDASIADMLDAIIWKYWFWKWSLNDLTSIAWVDAQQDYTISDSDFYRLYRVRFTRTDTTPDTVREKTVVNFLSPNLEQTGTIDSIMLVAYDYVTGKLRLDKAASVPTGVTVNIDGDYQMSHTKITSTSSTIVFPDVYLDVLVEGFKWKYKELINAPDAGTVTIDKSSRRPVYTGQYAKFMDALNSMAEAEGMGQGDAIRFPEDSLGVAKYTNPGLFAWG